MKKAIRLLLITGVPLLLAGCGKQDVLNGDYSRKPGSPVVFGISSDTETRTEYREGDFPGEIHPIDWKADDGIRIYSPEATRTDANSGKHWCDYYVIPRESDKRWGSLGNYTTGTLAWGDPGAYTFYSIYPRPAADDVDNPAGAGGRLSYTIPASQTKDPQMEYAFMTARATANTSTGTNAVRLDFYPAFTAFVFRLTASEPVILRSFKLLSSSMAVTGDCTAVYAADGTLTYTVPTVPANPTEPQTAPVDVNLGAVELATGDEISITVFAVPSDLTNMSIRLTASTPGPAASTVRTHNLQLKYSDSATGTGHTPGAYLVFDKCKRHVFKGVTGPYSTQLIEVNSQVVDWVSQGETEIEVIP